MTLQPIAPTITTPLFPGLSQTLLTLLRQLSTQEWSQPTACLGWSVKDLVAHLLGGNIGRLSSQRDRLPRSAAPRRVTSLVELTAWINEQNETWVRAARRISAPLLSDLLERTDTDLYAFFRALPPDAATGVAVAWAGETTSANWFDVGREYTEKWFHQQHIREAVHAPLLLQRHWFHPVIAICLRALPYVYRNVDASADTVIALRIDGEAGGDWSLLRQNQQWSLWSGARADAVTRITMSDDIAWRLFSKGLLRPEVQRAVTISGDVALEIPVWDLVAVMA